MSVAELTMLRWMSGNWQEAKK